MNRFSAGVVSWPLARRNSQLLCTRSLSPGVCQFVLVAARRFLQSVTYFVDRSARAPSCRFAFAAFDLLICAGVEAGPWWRAWVGGIEIETFD